MLLADFSLAHPLSLANFNLAHPLSLADFNLVHPLFNLAHPLFFADFNLAHPLILADFNLAHPLAQAGDIDKFITDPETSNLTSRCSKYQDFYPAFYSLYSSTAIQATNNTCLITISYCLQEHSHTL